MPNNMFVVDLEKVAAEWHPTKNSTRFEDVSPGSSTLVWWLGECGHEWETKMFARAARGAGCPFCGNRALLPGFNDIATVHPEWVKEWSPSNNKPCNEVLSGGKPEHAWLCELGHEFFSSVGHKERGRSCPYCLNMKVLPGFNDLASRYPELAQEWHPTKNDDLTPSMVIAGGRSKHWWVCSKGHEWDTTIHKRVVGSGCPVCANLKILPGFNDLAAVHPDVASEWHPVKNGELTPVDVSAGSVTVTWWQCVVGHEWETSVVNRTYQGNTCKECKKNTFAFVEGNLQVTHPDLAAEWHPVKNGEVSSDMIPASGGRGSAWWQCSKDPSHEWEAPISGRALRGRGCPQCWAKSYISKAEQELFEFIQSLDPDMVVVQPDKKVLKGRELDILVPGKNVAVEFNGLFWHSENAGKDKSYHHDKWLACKLAGVQLLQVWEDDWSRNSAQVKEMVAHKLGLSSQRRVFGRRTEVMLVDKVTAERFLNRNHVQGYAAGSYYVGLVEKLGSQVSGPGNLVALLVLRRESDGVTLNIIRYATSANVVGGFTKLLSFAEQELDVESFITFADHAVSDGGLYERNGFVADKILASDYMYVVDGVRKHKFGFRLKKFESDPGLLWEPGLTERELAELNGLERIWDAGKTRYRKNVN
jgi:hypothetical protein